MNRRSAQRVEPWRAARRRSALIVSLSITVILAVAVIVAVFLVPKLIAGSFVGHASHASASSSAVATSSSEEEPETPVIEEPEIQGAFIDASADVVEVTGTYIHVPGVRGFLQLTEATAVAAPDAKSETHIEYNVYSIAILPTEQVTDEMLEQCNSAAVVISGPVYFDEKNEPCMEAQSITDAKGNPLEFQEDD